MPILLSRISRNKSQRGKDVPLGESWIVHIFHRMRKEAIQIFAYTGKHLANYSKKLTIISKQSKLIPKKLRYQEKIHGII
jgi:hypothetical protein